MNSILQLEKVPLSFACNPVRVGHDASEGVMESILIRLSRESGGTCRVAASGWAHHVTVEGLDATLANARRLVNAYEDHRHAPLLDPAETRALGWQLADTFLPPLYADSISRAQQVKGGCGNLPAARARWSWRSTWPYFRMLN